MKKQALLLSIVSLMTVTGCKKEEEKPDYSKLFNLVTAEEPCLVNAKVKEYTDKMYKQREDAGVLPEEEDKIVDPLYSETVKIASYKGDYDESVPVELSFSVDETIKEETFKIRYWVEGKESEYKEVEPTEGKVSLGNLFRSTNYEWKVISSTGKESKVEYFTTGDYTRFLNVGQVGNFRDCGGWTTVEGKRIKQGLVYRGFEINDHKLSNGHAQNVFGDEDEAKKIFVDDLGIRAEVDLRSASEADNIEACGMNFSNVQPGDDRYVEYARPNITSYIDGLNKTSDQANIKIIFEDYLAKADEKPVYYHCYGGADRTGTIAFLLGAILGMTYTDLIIDYEATTFSNNLKEHDRDSDQYTHFPEMIAGIKAWSFYDANKPLSEVISTYLTETCKVSESTISKIRDIMLEDID